MALQDAEAFYDRLTHRLEQRYSIDETSLKKEQDALAKRNQDIPVSADLPAGALCLTGSYIVAVAGVVPGGQ